VRRGCSGRGEARCHGPASVAKSRKSQEKVVKIVDKVIELSRTSFEQELVRLRRELRRFIEPASRQAVREVGPEGHVTDQLRRGSV
jgi:hypothetical protein